MAWLKKRAPEKRYDPKKQVPVLKRSICTGETTAGFRDLETGKFHEIMLIETRRDLDAFMEQYGIDELPKTIY